MNALAAGALPEQAEGTRARLRRLTRDAHDAVDHAFGGYRIETEEGYARFLRAHSAALLPLEAALDRAGIGALLPDWEARRRAPALLADLATLGLPPAPPVPVAPLADEAAAMGAAYVLEGSRAGARLLLARAPEAARRAGADRYLSHGIGTGLWPGFLAILSAHGPSAQRPLASMAGAILAFDAFRAATATP